MGAFLPCQLAGNRCQFAGIGSQKLRPKDSEMAGQAERTHATAHLCPGYDFVSRGTALENSLVREFQGVRRHFLGVFGTTNATICVNVASPFESTPLWFWGFLRAGLER